jgi:hypothetical protein
MTVWIVARAQQPAPFGTVHFDALGIGAGDQVPG